MRQTILILALLFGLGGYASDLELLVEYPTPEPTEVELLPPGSTQSLIQTPVGRLLPSAVSIRVRMFPIISSPYRDPYPVVQDPNNVYVINKKGVSILSLADNIFLAKGHDLHFDFRNDYFLVDGEKVPLQPVEIIPNDPSVLSEITWDKGKRDSGGQSVEIAAALRGNFEIIKTYFVKKQKNRWSVINVLPLNQYLRSVLPSEILPTWHIEALKSQAVAARTYALYEMALARVKEKRNWDVDPTTWYQSYRGVHFRRGQRAIRVEHEATNRAVADSRHNVLTYNGEVIKAYFSSNSGGVTCSAKECFHLEGDNPPYLVSVPDAPGVKEKPYGTWGEKANITQQTIKERLKLMGFPDSIQVKELIVNIMGNSGRVWGLKVLLADQKEIVLNRIQSSGMMTLFGGVRSYLYSLFPPDINGTQKVVGHGLGHGVGMSQYGSLIFAEQGWAAEKILTYYYSGARLYSISSEDSH